MSLFSWFSRKPAPVRPRPVAEPSGLLNADATVPLTPGRQGRPLSEQLPPEHAANRKNERMERRELLYTVVRDAMVRAGVLSASYKFKVLSLDQRGRQFLVMMDLAREYGGETVRLSEIEALIAQTAKTRYDILVTAVYWRINDHVAVGIPQRGASAQPAVQSLRRPLAAAATASPISPAGAAVAAPQSPALAAGPATAPAAASRPAPLAAPSAPTAHGAAPPVQAPLASPPLAATPQRPSAGKYEPIEADEVAAFKRALAIAAGAASAGGSVAAAAAARPGVAVRSGPILAPSAPTGFEDTQTPVADGVSQDLSTTQYGDLN
ncbi:hypothetical protein [Acidovorax sp. RAC01]|uniref:hypothetical protein n=1 Tax=Acidovorax sp. RAC01 TaxID=1842533 RepID=UPI00083E7432|nr:hypothetical protein [Acidovorax sp. RAC01]AOG25041.1 hypothetical protein BSY15_1427 [Acidovorax sp. RAC01]